MKLFLAKFEMTSFPDLFYNPTERVIRSESVNEALRLVWRMPAIVEGGGDDDLTARPGGLRAMCPWCLAAVKRPFFVPFYVDTNDNFLPSGAFDSLSQEIARISTSIFSAKIKRAQAAFERVEAQAQGKAGEIRTDRTTKTEEREYKDKIKALGGLAEPTRDAFIETRTGGGDTSTINGTLEASPAEQFENAALGMRIRSPYEKAADAILMRTIPADFRERAGYYASMGADWWVYEYPEIFEAVEV